MTKGFIFDIKRYAIHDGPGIRTTVFFKGCAANCWWCHNPESQALGIQTIIRENRFDGKVVREEQAIGKLMSVGEVMSEILRDRLFYDESDGGVTFSGGEPLLQSAFLLELLTACRQAGIHTTLDTTGYTDPANFIALTGFVDLFLYDVKFIDENLHQKFTGVSNKDILKNIKFLISQRKLMRVRFPVIPGITATKKNVEEVIRFILNLNSDEIKIDLLAYHKIARHKYEKLQMDNRVGDVPIPTRETMQKIKSTMELAGLNVTIGG